jgi:hypothetical protein
LICRTPSHKCEHRISASPKVDFESQLSFISAPPEVHDDIEKQDLPSLSVSEIVQLICDTWERGLNDNRALRVLMGRVKKLLDESAEAGTDERHAHGEHGRFDGHREEGAETPRIRVDSENIERDVFSTTWPESSDASSMAYSYTVTSITSFNERTNWLFGHVMR